MKSDRRVWSKRKECICKCHGFWLCWVRSVAARTEKVSIFIFSPSFFFMNSFFVRLVVLPWREAQMKTVEDIVTRFFDVAYGLQLAFLATLDFDPKSKFQSPEVGSQEWTFLFFFFFKNNQICQSTCTQTLNLHFHFKYSSGPLGNAYSCIWASVHACLWCYSVFYFSHHP